MIILYNPRLHKLNLYQTIILDYKGLSCCPQFPDECNCRRSIDLPNCSAKEAATTIVGQTQTRGHDPCYNPKLKSHKGSERKSMAIKRPTNAIEHAADGQKIDLTREVSNKEKKNLLNVPDRPHELQNLSIEGES